MPLRETTSLLKKILWRLELLLVQGVYAFFNHLPTRHAYAIGEFFAFLVLLILPRYKTIILNNLLRTGVAKDRREAKKLLRESVRAQGWNSAEFFLLERMIRPDQLAPFIRLDIEPRALEVLSSGQSAVIFSGHLGNWELSGITAGTFIPRLYAIAKTQKNPYLSDWINRRRKAFRMQIIDKEGALIPLIRALKNGSALAFINDQNAGRKGIFVDFFGRPTSTFSIAAQLAVKYQLPVFFGYDIREENRPDRHCFVMKVLECPTPSGDLEKDAALLTQRYSTLLEETIRRYPAQYLWGHRRWRHQPGDRNDRNADLHPDF